MTAKLTAIVGAIGFAFIAGRDIAVAGWSSSVPAPACNYMKEFDGKDQAFCDCIENSGCDSKPRQPDIKDMLEKAKQEGPKREEQIAAMAGELAAAPSDKIRQIGKILDKYEFKSEQQANKALGAWKEKLGESEQKIREFFVRREKMVLHWTLATDPQTKVARDRQMTEFNQEVGNLGVQLNDAGNVALRFDQSAARAGGVIDPGAGGAGAIAVGDRHRGLGQQDQPGAQPPGPNTLATGEVPPVAGSSSASTKPTKSAAFVGGSALAVGGTFALGCSFATGGTGVVPCAVAGGGLALWTGVIAYANAPTH